MSVRRLVSCVAACASLAAWLPAIRAQQTPAPAAAPQYFLGRLSDSMCAGSHQAMATSRKLTDRECIFECLKAQAKYVLVDQSNKVIPIANQDAAGIPLYAGRPVRIIGEMKDGAIVASKVEAIPAHLHIGHVMTNWRDTPGSRGFLPVAVDEARVATTHAKLAIKAATLDEMKLHAGHVVNALDTAVEPKGPGAGYGVKKAVAGAIQHLEFATKAEGLTANITSHASPVSAALHDVALWTDEAVGLAQKARASADATEAAKLLSDLDAMTTKIADRLQEAQSHMSQMVKAEGLEGAPR
jgi:hypothetical protein